MDLPFAVDSPDRRASTSLHHSNASSLVTASSQGSLLPVDSPEHSSMYSSNEQSYSNTIISPHSEVVPAVMDAELNDFTYVNVCETDADEVDILMDGRVPSPEEDTTRGDVLAVLLSGGTQDQDAGESIVVSSPSRCCLLSGTSRPPLCSCIYVLFILSIVGSLRESQRGSI